MARAIQQIKRELAALEEIVSNLGVELGRIYAKYLSLLSQSVRKQLVLASYQICTQAYPESFLSLSFNQRQKLQENLRQLGNRVQTQLFQYLEESNQSAAPPNLNPMEQMLSKLQIPKQQGENQVQQLLSREQELPAPTPTKEIEVGENLPDTTEISSHLTESTGAKVRRINNPEDLVQWHKQVEQGINETLESLSREANRYLQQANVLPNKLPVKVIEMAMQAEENSSTIISGSPNLLNLIIETEKDERTQDSNITKITVLRLQLSEIEFSDQTLSAERNQIRNLLERIGKIRQQYQKKQRECAVAEAEAAWRSSWFDD
ncbi:MAG: hypothetical protein AB4426_04330 [Xenococcaceae cyanobacterium]